MHFTGMKPEYKRHIKWSLGLERNSPPQSEHSYTPVHFPPDNFGFSQIFCRSIFVSFARRDRLEES
jgi:hypothetical protein